MASLTEDKGNGMVTSEKPKTLRSPHLTLKHSCDHMETHFPLSFAEKNTDE